MWNHSWNRKRIDGWIDLWIHVWIDVWIDVGWRCHIFGKRLIDGEMERECRNKECHMMIEQQPGRMWKENNLEVREGREGRMEGRN